MPLRTDFHLRLFAIQSEIKQTILYNEYGPFFRLSGL